MGKLFGTDGIRGVANRYPMDAETALKAGRAIAEFFKSDRQQVKLLVGKDTRVSGDMLENALIAGITSTGTDAVRLGVIPTPAVAYLTAKINAGGGVVVSASHNPFYDNGIKVFGGDGFKLCEADEGRIERMILDDAFEEDIRDIRDTGRMNAHTIADDQYIEFLLNSLPSSISFQNIRIVLDCSNGATYRVAPRLFTELGAAVEVLAADPDGRNINDNCGSQHPQVLAGKVLEYKANLGLAFDGDGDRLIAVDEQGAVLTGDQLLALCAKALKKNNALKNNVVVSTVMSNMGLPLALKNLGIDHIATPVGDRHVALKMREIGAVLGGEESGHTIFMNHHTTGDGILAGLNLLQAMLDLEAPLSELGRTMTVFPQQLISVDVKQKPELATVPEIVAAIEVVEAQLGGKGRVLVRYSGTQPQCRVMVEGPTASETETYCRQIADVIEQKLN